MVEEIFIGTRGSRLALAQADIVCRFLQAVTDAHEFTVREITTTGDVRRQKALNEIGGQGLFVKEIQLALMEGKIDMAVHSAKDMPMKDIEGLRVAAYPQRADARDVVVGDRGGLKDLPDGSVLGTGSLRRRAHILHHYPHLKIKPLRGNIGSRLDTVKERGWAGAVLAAAGLHRLGWEERIAQYVPYDICLPAAGQGALAIEIRAEDGRIAELVKAINDERVESCVKAERTVLATLAGGCHVPVGVLAQPDGDHLLLRATVGTREGKRIIGSQLKGSPKEPERVGEKAADELLAQGAAEILEDAAKTN